MLQTTDYVCGTTIYGSADTIPSISIIAGYCQWNAKTAQNKYIYQCYDYGRYANLATSNKEDGKISMIYVGVDTANLNSFSNDQKQFFICLKSNCPLR